MVKYRKKPIVIEAEQWWPNKVIDGVRYKPEQVTPAIIQTLEGKMEVSAGDWIITGVNGEKYSCKPEIFEKTYEKVME